MGEKIYFNGDILTLEKELYVEALLVKNGKIKKVGKKDDLIKIADRDVEFIDLNGKTLMPSFIDAHSHFLGYAISFKQVNVEEATNFQQICEVINKFIMDNKLLKGEWIQVEGYDQNFLEEKIHPTRELLDKAAPNNPLVIKHKSGHMGVFNTMALKELNITHNIESPKDGLIEKKNGILTGYMEEGAFLKYIQKLPMISNEEFTEILLKAQESYSSYGITTVQEGFIVKKLEPILKYLMLGNILKIDLIGYIDISNADELKDKFSMCLNKYSNHIKIGGYKTFLDGSPQVRTAWMRTPYKGKDKHYYAYGMQTDEEIEEKLEKALKENMQILVHCNGDAACEQYIKQYKVAKEKIDGKRDIRPVIVHAQFLDRDQLDKVKKLKMIPSFFVAHIYYWGDVHIKNFGRKRASRISLAKSADKKGILYTFHQDSPVIKPNMLETIWCAVNRITKNGVVLCKEERITPLDALKSITINAAYQYFEEDIKGSLKEGKLADMVILDKNILKVAPMEIKDIQVLETIKEGSTIFKK